jgi:hypothetical protein
MPSIQIINHSSQLSPQPEGKPLRQKVDKEAEPFQKHIYDVSDQPISSLNPNHKLQISIHNGPLIPPLSPGRLVIGIYLGFAVSNLVLVLFFSFVRKRFVNQHYGDIILDGIEQATGLADQTIPLSIQENISLAFGTG